MSIHIVDKCQFLYPNKAPKGWNLNNNNNDNSLKETKNIEVLLSDLIDKEDNNTSESDSFIELDNNTYTNLDLNSLDYE